MGKLLDIESDGQPSANARGDDILNIDDEDGVQFNADIVPGIGVPISVIVQGVDPGAVAFLDAWIDYNKDGDFDDANEQILFSTAVTNSGPTFATAHQPNTVPVPDFEPGLTYARFRISSEGGLAPGGMAMDGEVEDYLIFIGNRWEYQEFGDAPASYEQGDPARHIYDNNMQIFLGTQWDAETGPQSAAPGAEADGDDLNGQAPDDEDGVAGTSQVFVPSKTTTLTVTYTNDAPAMPEMNIKEMPAVLEVYIDWNADGIFDPATETIYADNPDLLAGGQLEVEVPPRDQLPQIADYEVSYMTYARFRLHRGYSDPDDMPTPEDPVIIGPTGLGWNPDHDIEEKLWVGEVEDYKIVISNLDFGDAPELPQPTDYPTTLAKNGARHLIDIWPSPYFEDFAAATTDLPDAEMDGQPTDMADGDDLDPEGDDEDGLLLVNPVVRGEIATINVNVANGPAYVNVWFDQNGSFDWTEASDHVFSGVLNGLSTITFAVSGNAPDMTFLRMRVSSLSDDADEPTGLAHDGEVEDHKINVFDADYGDLPDAGKPGPSTGPGNYQTLKEDNGPRHVIVPDVAILGALIDDELDGLEDIRARGDDIIGIDDEDGVNLPAVLKTGTTFPLEVTASADGSLLNAWIDWNQDGDFADAGEQIATNLAVVAGVNVIPIVVPPGAEITDMNDPFDLTYARFRISTQAGLSPTGFAIDGEVEDYKLDVMTGMDFGDLPQADYSTLVNDPDPPHPELSDPGPKHNITGLYLGEKIDADNDGQPPRDGNGDLLNVGPALGDDDEDTYGDPTDPAKGDDEDGIWFSGPVNVGQEVWLTVKSHHEGNQFGNRGRINIWIDYNQDGDFDDVGEHVIDDMLTTGGNDEERTTTVHFTVPSTAKMGNTYMRVRLSGQQELDLGPDGPVPATGLIPIGEVEDYEIVLGMGGDPVVNAVDFGDAPDTYGTTIAANGAQHTIVPLIHLGATVDKEPNGQPSVGADGDDLDAPANDEDGVTFLNGPDPGREVDGYGAGDLFDAWLPDGLH